MNAPYLTKTTRRSTLQWFAAATLGAAIPPYALAGTVKRVMFEGASKGYGTDPDLNQPVVPWIRVMTPYQLQLTAVLSDLILPGSEHAPTPSALGIPDFVDEWISAPYPQQRADRRTILDGLKRIDVEARRRWERSLLEIDDQQRQDIIAPIARKSANANVTGQNTFFSRLRFLVLGGYYTTPAGFKDIGYVGNVPIARYPPVTEEERKILEDKLSRLGLSRP